MMDSNGNRVIKKGSWSSKEDAVLVNYIKQHGVKQCWRSLPFQAGLMRSGKSCRLRWMNYLRPDVKIGGMTLEEEDLIILLHKLLGNRWSLIAGRLPGRTDNEIKNYWKSHIRKHLTKNNNTLEAPCSRSKHGHRIEENPKSLDIDILHQVDQLIENGGTPFDLGTYRMATNSSDCCQENVLIEKNTPTTSSTNYHNSTQDYEIGSCVSQVHDRSIKESVVSIIEEATRKNPRSPTNQKNHCINDNLDASQTSFASTNIHAPYVLQGDIHSLVQHLFIDDTMQLMV